MVDDKRPTSGGRARYVLLLGGAIVGGCSENQRPVDTSNATPDAQFVPRFEAGVSDATIDGGADATATLDGPPCEAGQTVCEGQCSSTSSDPKNCGHCGNLCDPTVVCSGGQCVCDPDAGLALCNGKCVNEQSDPSNCGACNHSCQGSTCMGALCVPTIVAQTSGTPVWGLAVDSAYVYWTQVAMTGNNGAASRKPFASLSSATLMLSYPNDPLLDDPRGIAVDNLNMYWVDYASGAVEGYSLMGASQVIVLRPSLIGDGSVSDSPIDIVSDGEDVYWVTYDGGQVLRAPISGAGPVTVMATGENHPHAVAVDGTNVYWVDFGSANRLVPSGSVKQIAKNVDGGTTMPTILADNEAQPWALVVDPSSVYWTDRANPGAVKKVPIGGGTITTLAPSPGGAPLGAPFGIAVDADYVYWTNFDDGTVKRLPKAGGAEPSTLASGQSNPAAIAVDTNSNALRATNLWWVNQGAMTIVKLAR